MCSGSPKLHGDKRTCPAKQKLEPCTCKVKTTGLDITCQRVSRAQMERVATNMKQDIKPSDDVSVTSSQQQSSVVTFPVFCFRFGISKSERALCTSCLTTSLWVFQLFTS